MTVSGMQREVVHGCQMAIAGSLDRMCLALRASGLWLCYAVLQNLIPSFPGIAPGWRAWGRNPRRAIPNFAIWQPWLQGGGVAARARRRPRRMGGPTHGRRARRGNAAAGKSGTLFNSVVSFTASTLIHHNMWLFFYCANLADLKVNLIVNIAAVKSYNTTEQLPRRSPSPF